jgi:hypothetical protein
LCHISILPPEQQRATRLPVLTVVRPSGDCEARGPACRKYRSRRLIWRTGCQGLCHEVPAFAGVGDGGVVGWVGGGPACCARRGSD